MCRPSLRPAILAVSFLFLGLAANADKVVLTDGTVLDTAKPYAVKGNNALLTLRDGTLVSVKASTIDVSATAAANAPAPVPAAKPAEAGPRQPTTPAEAARVKGRRATVVLGDEDVSHPISGGEEGGSKARGAGRVEVSNVATSRAENGLISINGSAVNTGDADVTGVTVTIEGVSKDNRTLTTAFGVLAKDSLAPGEKSSFTAEVEDAGYASFRYLPKWQVKVEEKKGGAGAAAPAGAPQGGATAAGGGAGAATEGEKPTQPAANPTPVVTMLPRGDLAAPPANVPVGQPAGPNSGYLPGYSSTAQPKPIAK